MNHRLITASGLAALASLAAAVSTESIKIPHGQDTLAGTVYRPTGFDATKKYPAVIVTGAWFTIKEQMPSFYARRFAEQGYVAMVFDFRNFGESTGKARNFEDTKGKTEDIGVASRFFAKQPYVDVNRLAGMAMCASTGYMANAIVEGAPFKAFAASALWIQDKATVEAVYGGADSVAALIQQGDEARAEFEKSGRVIDVPAAGTPGSNAIMQQAPYYQDPNRGLIAKWDNKFAIMSWGSWLRFDSLAAASRINIPTLVMHSDNAALPAKAREFHANLAGPKAIFWSEEAHMDFYDSEVAVNRSVGLAIDHFDRYLAKPSDIEMVEETVRQVANSVDAKSWPGVRQLFADQLLVDYSSLGGPKGTVNSDQIVKDWAAFHNQFSDMRHTYTNFATSVNGNKATTRYQGIASLSRPIGETMNRWIVAGDYVTTLEKKGGKWLVTGTAFQLRYQVGTP